MLHKWRNNWVCIVFTATIFQHTLLEQFIISHLILGLVVFPAPTRSHRKQVRGQGIWQFYAGIYLQKYEAICWWTNWPVFVFFDIWSSSSSSIWWSTHWPCFFCFDHHCTFGKSVLQDVDSLEKLFLLTGETKVTKNFRIAHWQPYLGLIFWKN